MSVERGIASIVQRHMEALHDDSVYDADPLEPMTEQEIEDWT